MKRSPLKRTAPLKRKTKLKPVSSKTAKRNAEYRRLRAEWIDGKQCAAEGCHRVATDVQHTAGRYPSVMLDVSTWLPLCRPCHSVATVEPAAAYASGLAVRRHVEGEGARGEWARGLRQRGGAGGRGG